MCVKEGGAAESSASAEPNGGGTKLFPRFNAKVPMSYEKVRLILNAMMIGEHDLAQAVNENLQLSAEKKKKRTVVHFVRFPQLLDAWKAALKKLKVLRKQLEDSGSTAVG